MGITSPILIYTTPAVILRRVDYGDYDYILTLLTPDYGKVSVLAKNAKKSVKRFAGSLELFYQVEAVIRQGVKLSFLEEITIENTYMTLRSDIVKAAYASYWSEILVQWLESGTPQNEIFHLLIFCLGQLDAASRLPAELSVLFQMKFLALTGFLPEMNRCGRCDTEVDNLDSHRVSFDITSGWIVCSRCRQPAGTVLSKGTLKQLLWICDAEIDKMLRVKFSGAGMNEALRFLEAFLPYHLEKEIRSLSFLKKMRALNG